MVGWIDLPIVAPFVRSLEFGFSFAPRVKSLGFFKFRDFVLIDFTRL
jgi:hypothetical protein